MPIKRASALNPIEEHSTSATPGGGALKIGSCPWHEFESIATSQNSACLMKDHKVLREKDICPWPLAVVQISNFKQSTGLSTLYCTVIKWTSWNLQQQGTLRQVQELFCLKKLVVSFDPRSEQETAKKPVFCKSHLQLWLLLLWGTLTLIDCSWHQDALHRLQAAVDDGWWK